MKKTIFALATVFAAASTAPAFADGTLLHNSAVYEAQYSNGAGFDSAYKMRTGGRRCAYRDLHACAFRSTHKTPAKRGGDFSSTSKPKRA